MRLLRLALAVVLTASVAVLCEMVLVPDAIARMRDAISAPHAIIETSWISPDPMSHRCCRWAEAKHSATQLCERANGGMEATFRESRLLAERHAATHEYPRLPRIYDASGHDG
jgi:hypothetical protein